MPIVNGREIVLHKKYTMAVTGHRIMKDKISKNILKVIFENAIMSGYDTFLVGMALGFDTLCFQVLEEVRKEYNIRIIACVPCRNQHAYFNNEQKKEYVRMVNSADDYVLLQDNYTKTCMLDRNRFMVDNCSLLLAYLREDKGGTKFTVDYAEEKGVNVRII